MKDAPLFNAARLTAPGWRLLLFKVTAAILVLVNLHDAMHYQRVLVGSSTMMTSTKLSPPPVVNTVQVQVGGAAAHQSGGGYYDQDECFVPGKGSTTFRFPTASFQALAQQPRPSSNNSTAVVFPVGVLSTAHRPDDRRRVRKTWAFNRTNVFFLVAGNWTEISDEFQEHGDLLWVDDAESYRGVTVKVLVWLAAVAKHIPNYGFIMKTDDDSYIRLHEVEQVVIQQQEQQEGQSVYRGNGCRDKDLVIRDPDNKWYVPTKLYNDTYYPPYAYGGGYILSKDVNDCAVEHMEQRSNDPSVFPIEDAFVGILAVNECRATCTHDSRLQSYSMPKPYNVIHKKLIDNKLLLHQIKRERDMVSLHQRACCSSRSQFSPDPISCASEPCFSGLLEPRTTALVQ